MLYRLGTKQPSTTFSTLDAAEEFKELVDHLGPDRALRILVGQPVRGLTGTEFAKVASLLGPDRAMQAMTGDEQPRGITVAQLWERFIEWKDDDLTPRTRQDYRRDYGNHIEPWFAHMVADDVDEGDVQKWVDHMRKTLGPKTVADRHMILHSMYEFGRARSRQLASRAQSLQGDRAAQAWQAEAAEGHHHG